MRFRRRPWLTLLACLAAAAAARAQLPGATGPGPLAPPDNAASGLDLDWRIPPIATSGSVSYDLRAARARDEPNTLSQLVTAEVAARSYIYQPWFGTVSGNLRLTTGSTRSAAHGDPALDPFASQGEATAKDRFLTGRARLDLFPISRFPFEFHVERSDSRIDSTLASALSFGTQNIGFSQRYRPVDNSYILSGSYDRRQQFGLGFRDTQNLLSGDFSRRWKHHELSLGLSFSDAKRQANDDQAQFRSLVARHRYAPAGALSVDTTVNWSKTDEHVSDYQSDLSVLQWSSVGLWQRVGSKLTMSGSVRGVLVRDGITEQAMDSLGMTLGASYELNRNARFTANGSVNATSSNGAGARSFGGSVGASWQGDSLEFKGLRYDWFAGASAGGSFASSDSKGSEPAGGDERQTNLGAQAGHTLSRSWVLTPGSTLLLNAGQTLALARNSNSRSDSFDTPSSSRLLMHTAAASWNVSGDNRSAYARASYSDSKELGGDARFQLFNFQLSGNFAFDRNRSLTGDLTYQRTAQRSSSLPHGEERLLLPGERTGTRGASGEITYRHQRLFGVPRLTFSSRLKLAQDVLRQPGTLATVPDRETKLWENRLDWQVGRLDNQLVFRMSEVDGRRREFLMWRVQRNFGD